MVTRLTLTVVGVAQTGDAYNGSLITLQGQGQTITSGPIVLYATASNIISTFVLGQTVFIDISTTSTDQSNIAGVDTVVADGTQN